LIFYYFQVKGFLHSIGFSSRLVNADRDNPCQRFSRDMANSIEMEVDGSNENENTSDELDNDDDGEWVLFGTHTCLKVINGLHTYSEATRACNDQFKLGRYRCL